MKKIIVEGGYGVFTVVKKYNEFVWRLKSDTGEIINVFYSLNHKYTEL